MNITAMEFNQAVEELIRTREQCARRLTRALAGERCECEGQPHETGAGRILICECERCGAEWVTRY